MTRATTIPMSASEYRARSRALAAAVQPKRKYRNEPCAYKGKRFDSKLEMRRYIVLEDYQKKGKIRGLARQRPWQLTAHGANICKIKPDFEYWITATDKYVIADAKGRATAEWLLKAKIFAAQYGYPIKIITEKTVGSPP